MPADWRSGAVAVYLGEKLGYLQDGPQTLDQLVARRLLYPVGFHLPYVESAERNSIRMHLLRVGRAGAGVAGCCRGMAPGLTVPKGAVR